MPAPLQRSSRCRTSQSRIAAAAVAKEGVVEGALSLTPSSSQTSHTGLRWPGSLEPTDTGPGPHSFLSGPSEYRPRRFRIAASSSPATEHKREVRHCRCYKASCLPTQQYTGGGESPKVAASQHRALEEGSPCCQRSHLRSRPSG